MDVLLDTHSILWYALVDRRLSTAARIVISDPAITKWISPARYWEIAIKISTGKYSLTMPCRKFFRTAIKAKRYRVLGVRLRHTDRLIALPLHHRDPLDRLLIVQSVAEGFPVVGSDVQFDPYGIVRIW